MDIILPQKDEIQKESNVKEEKKEVMHGSLLPHRGHKMWEIHRDLSVREARYVDASIESPTSKKSVIRKKLVVKKDCAYISALNAKNALKRFTSGKGSAFVALNPNL